MEKTDYDGRQKGSESKQNQPLILRKRCWAITRKRANASLRNRIRPKQLGMGSGEVHSLSISSLSEVVLFFLETATGLEGFEINENVQDSNGLPRRFHILVRAPASAAVHQALIERIIQREKPAYVTYDLEFKE